MQRRLRTVFAVLLFELAAAVNAFGGLVRAEVEEITLPRRGKPPP